MRSYWGNGSGNTTTNPNNNTHNMSSGNWHGNTNTSNNGTWKANNNSRNGGNGVHRTAERSQGNSYFNAKNGSAKGSRGKSNNISSVREDIISSQSNRSSKQSQGNFDEYRNQDKVQTGMIPSAVSDEDFNSIMGGDFNIKTSNVDVTSEKSFNEDGFIEDHSK